MRVLFSILSLFIALNLFGKEINVTYPRAPLNLQLIVMKHKGLLQKEFAKDGIKIKFHDITSGLKQIRAVAAGKIDICGSVNTTSLIIAKGQNIRLKIVRAVCNSDIALSLMTINPSIKSIKDLKGKTIACTKGGTLHQMLLEVLQKNNMTIEDINYIPMLTEAYKAMFAGKVDAAVLNTAETVKAKKRGARILTTARGLMREKLVVAVSEPFLKNHLDWVKRYLKVQDEAIKFIKNHKREALELAAKDLDISYQDVEWLYENTKLIKTLSQDLNSLKDDIAFLYQQKMIRKKPVILSPAASKKIYLKKLVREQISRSAVSYN
ncbi:MAG: ABC transporter substrate-binding protein [Lentisphaerae bacterium]|nr:ABC transporter substrate-binding protein [Lentisphaerota bacterium]